MTFTRCMLLGAFTTALGVAGCGGTDITNVTSVGGSDSGSGGTQNEGGSNVGGATPAVETGGAISNISTGGTTNLGSSQLATGGDAPSGGASAMGGTRSTGGSRATGGVHATGGAPIATGGVSSAGGTRATGGAIATGGARATGGATATGGANATGGAVSAGGSSFTTGGAASTGTGTHTNPLSQTLIDEFVAAHNAARSGPLNPTPSPPLPPVSWDYTLADSAYNYLSKCPGGNIDLAPHNANRTSDYKALGGTDSVGENIYASTGKTVSPTAAVGKATDPASAASWMSEASKYDYNTNNITAAGHYTQVVWRTSVRIGCAIVNCPNYTFSNTILCDYAPAGNNTSQKPY